MSKTKDPIESILDTENTDNITLFNGDEKIEFQQVCLVELDGNQYCILRPVEQFEEMEDDQALTFCIKQNEDESKFLEIVNDNELLDRIFKEYYTMLDKLYADIEKEKEEDNED